MAINIKNITISISQIAPLVGLDKYKNFSRIFCELWRRNYPIEFKIYEDKLKNEGYKQLATSNEINDIWEADEALGTNILQQIKELNTNISKTSSYMVSKQESISKYINENNKFIKLDTLEKQSLIQKVLSITNKTHGIINEDSILLEFSRLTEKTIKNTQGLVEIPLNIIVNIENKLSTELSTQSNKKQLIKWSIIGKYDGITTDNELVEAKMRQKSVFKKIRDYENVQVQLYLHALKFDQAYLVESYTNKKNINSVYVNEVKYDETYVTEIILDRIHKFISFFTLLMDNHNDCELSRMKETLLKGDKDRKIYQIYEREYIGIEEIDF